jgi:hypothetical protein
MIEKRILVVRNYSMNLSEVIFAEKKYQKNEREY